MSHKHRGSQQGAGSCARRRLGARGQPQLQEAWRRGCGLGLGDSPHPLGPRVPPRGSEALARSGDEDPRCCVGKDPTDPKGTGRARARRSLAGDGIQPLPATCRAAPGEARAMGSCRVASAGGHRGKPSAESPPLRGGSHCVWHDRGQWLHAWGTSLPEVTRLKWKPANPVLLRPA